MATVFNMERPYLFFHTGTALLLAVLLLPVSGYVGGLLLELMPDIKILQFLAAFAGCAAILWIPCWLDYHLAQTKKIGKD